jgi:hypothetical protein
MVKSDDIPQSKISGTPLHCVKEEEESNLINYSSNLKRE